MLLSTGSDVLNSLLSGGYQSGTLNTIYGPASSGKTTACLLAAISCANLGKKTIFIDSEKGFSVERLEQLTGDYRKVLSFITLINVDSFEGQTKVLKKVSDLAEDNKIGLVIVDTLGSHFRAARHLEAEKRNNLFLDQLNYLREIYKNSEVVVLVTTQVYASVEDDSDEVKPIGGRMLVNKSRCLIELGLLNRNTRYAVLKKHPNSSEEKKAIFKIEEQGFV